MNTFLVTNSIEKSKKFICQQLQAAWDTEKIKDNRKKAKDFLTESDYFKIIDSKEKYNVFDMKFIPEIIFIVPELNWSNDDVNEGYDIARDLITKKYKSDFIQLVFLSVLERTTLKEISDVRNKSFAEAFPHVCLLDSEPGIQFFYYSDIHYKLIKHLAISDEGRLQRISHEMNSVKTNILKETREVGYNRTDLTSKLEELSLFQQWTGIKITDEIEKANNATANVQLALISKTTENIIDEIDLRLSSKGVSDEIKTRDKTNYKVFIIEDDKEYRKFFRETFSRFYTEVYPDKNDSFPFNKTTKDFTISEAEDIIKTIGKSFNIFLLDLLYKDDAGNWLNFNGLDLYRLVKSVNPYAVRRIITSLPRGIVAKLAEVITSDTEKPNIDQVYTKKYGFDYLKDTIIESIEKINEECRSKSKSKTVLSPFPKTGIYVWSGVPELMFSLLHDKKDQYYKHRNISDGIFNHYLKGTLVKSTIGWNNGELPKPAMKKKVTDSYFLGKLSSIMTHRLIALNEALKNDDFVVHYTDYLEVIENLTNITQLDKGYFQTKLGFNGTEIKKNENPVGFRILFSNLFPEEISFITKTLASKDDIIDNSLLKNVNSDLNEFFIRILEDLTTYESWEELKLDYDPYLPQKNNIDNGNPVSTDDLPDFSLKQLLDFLQALVANYDKEFIEPMVQLVTDYAPGSNKIKYRPVEILIDNLYSK
ncbi:MAG TPA: hypothetical protein P5531_01640 [Bacteroidales bacterium]|nr:hypothetical protein [Bacteroidales bacterium]HSA42358.1 hypothetical protein [Bacteroidales bacterium]